MIVARFSVKIYEKITFSVSTSSMLQPLQLFTADSFFIDNHVYFAAENSIFTFDIIQKSFCIFCAISDAKIIKLASTSRCVNVLYSNNEGVKCMTFVTGSKIRNEIAIDICTDTKQCSWIFDSEYLSQYKTKLIYLEEVSKTPISGYSSLFSYLDTVCLYSSSDEKGFLVGNKADLNKKREVTVEEGRKKANSNNAVFYEVNVKTRLGINELFDAFSKEICRERSRNDINIIS